PIQIRNLGVVESAMLVFLPMLVAHPSAYQFGLWIQVDRAAPIPVPVQMRMPRLNMAEACPTPAVESDMSATSGSGVVMTLHFREEGRLPPRGRGETHRT